MDSKSSSEIKSSFQKSYTIKTHSGIPTFSAFT